VDHRLIPPRVQPSTTGGRNRRASGIPDDSEDGPGDIGHQRQRTRKNDDYEAEQDEQADRNPIAPQAILTMGMSHPHCRARRPKSLDPLRRPGARAAGRPFGVTLETRAEANMRKLTIILAGVLLFMPAALFAQDGWISMFDGKTLNGWKANEHPDSWKVVDGAITGDGPSSHLFWMVRECENCEFKAEVKLNHSGNSGMYFRTAFGPGFPKGYEAQVENSSPDPQKTGSLYNFSKVLEQLIPDDTWWNQDVIANGTHIIIKVNGKTVVDFVDEKNTYKNGYLALQQHNAGSVVQFRNLMMRPLPAGGK
jgi:Domain of Unknown Function (DUF1080)